MLEAMVLDEYFRNIFILDNYQSFIWTDKYQSYGDFELYSPPTPEIVKNVRKDYYIWLRNSDRAMIVDKIELDTDIENGDMITITGKSLESILSRRVLIDQSISSPIDENIQDYIEKVFNKCFGLEADADRKISNMFFERNPDLESSHLSEGETFLATGDFFGKNVYEIVETLCKSNNLGFKITLEERMLDGFLRDCFILKLYNGVDRSYDQELHPYVVFSSNYGNLLTSSYYSTYENYKNFAYCHYEKSGNNEEEAVNYIESAHLGEDIPIGLYRREMFISGSISNENEGSNSEKIDPTPILIQQAYDGLKENDTTEAFDGEVDPYGQYQYGRDFQVGDIVQIVNHNGYKGKTRVTAITYSSDINGESIYPTFEQTDDLLASSSANNES